MSLILGQRAVVRDAIGFSVRERSEPKELLTYSGDGHLITFAPTGTGKTSGPVICNALRHPGQLIVLDMKGEVHAATAETRRAMGQEVHVLDLRDNGIKGSLNPLALAARCGDESSAIARSFAGEIIDRGYIDRDPFWNNWAETMVTGGLSWFLADQPPDKRKLSALFDMYTQDDVAYALAVMLDTKQVKDRSAKAAFHSFLQLPEKETRPSVLGTTQAQLRLFDSDLVRRLTDTSSMDVDALLAGQPMTLYIIVPPFRLAAFRPILRLWLSSLIHAMTNRTIKPKHRTLMLCDEVGNLGHMEALLTASTLLRSWGLTLWTFFQNPAQMQIYGNQAHTLIDNAAVVQIFGLKNYRAAQDAANIIGGISPDELLKLRSDEQVLLIEGKLHRAKQVRYYDEKTFPMRR